MRTAEQKAIRAARQRAFYRKHRERILAQQRLYAHAHRDAIRERMRKYVDEHREQVRALSRASARRRMAKILAYTAAHPEQRRETARRYRQAHPEVIVAKEARRRARAAEAGGSYTAAEWRELVARTDGRCAYCGSRPTRLTVDHRLPIARGGSNAIENISPACWPCNLRKGTKTAEEFLAQRVSGSSSGMSG